MKRKSTKGAMEMSVGTIVTIVLLMSVLILGLVLVKNIFSSANGAIKLSGTQLDNQISKAFGDSSTRAVMYPTSNALTIKVGKSDAMGVGIKNIANNVNDPTDFTYEVSSPENSCGLTNDQAMKLIMLGKATSSPINIPIGQLYSGKITFQIPDTMPNCLITYDVNIKRAGTLYATPSFVLTVKP